VPGSGKRSGVWRRREETPRRGGTTPTVRYTTSSPRSSPATIRRRPDAAAPGGTRWRSLPGCPRAPRLQSSRRCCGRRDSRCYGGALGSWRGATSRRRCRSSLVDARGIQGVSGVWAHRGCGGVLAGGVHGGVGTGAAAGGDDEEGVAAAVGAGACVWARV